jgi:hypothetical protein
MKTRIQYGVLMAFLLLSLLVATARTELNQLPSDKEIRWKVISSGGNVNATSEHYRMDATVAQTAVGESFSPGRQLRHGFWQEFGPLTCCEGRVGDANGLGTYPKEVTISDIQLLVFAKFISSLPCEQNLHCLAEADVNQTGGVNPKCSDVTISDIQTLVNHLFIAGPTSAPLKSCL